MIKAVSVHLFVLILISANLLYSQTVTEKFDKIIYSEGFDSSKTDWPVISNSENLIIVQDGEYILSRKTTLSPFAITSKGNFDYKGFKIVTSLKLDKGLTPESSIGLMFMIQPDNAGAWMLEFNMNKEFRIRKLSGKTFTYFTGSEKNSGWIKNNSINEPTLPTLIEIYFAAGKFDISFNHKPVLNFSDMEFESGSIGFSIGPGTKGRVDFLYFFTNSKYMPVADLNEKNEHKPEAELSTMLESIINLKTQVNTLTEENELLKRTIDAMKSENQTDETEKKLMIQKLSMHETEMAQSQKRYDSLLLLNASLDKYREIVEGNENKDLVLTLSKSLKAEMEKNKMLADSIKTLQKLNQPKLQIPNDGGQKQGASGTPNQSSNSGSSGTSQQSNNPGNQNSVKPAVTTPSESKPK